MKLNDTADPSTLGWLLEDSNPSARFFTLTKLLGKPSVDAEVREAKQAIMRAGVVPEILARQEATGFWGNATDFYTEKYTGTVWQLLILAELGADPGNERIRKACEFILENAQEPESGGFSIHTSVKNGGGRRSEVIPCLTGNMVWSFIRLGFGDDERVQKGIDWICRYQRCDDGVPPDAQLTGWPYERNEMCWGRHTCHMGAVKALKALSAIPEADRSHAVQAKINELTEYLLIHHIYKKSHDIQSVSKPGWMKFGFPMMYQTDVLEILGILTDLGCRDERMGEALELLRSKRNENSRWLLENSFNSKMIKNIEAKGSESKWITAKALYVLANQ